jgi:AraC-like DNA-binding protein
MPDPLDQSQQVSQERLTLMSGDWVEIPGARGRMEQMDFGNGLFLHLAELDVYGEAAFAVENYMAPGWIGGSWNILGSLEIAPPGMPALACDAQHALIMRIDISGTQYRLPAGQLIRHVGVTGTLDALRQRYEGSFPDRLAPFLGSGSAEVGLERVGVTARMRHVGASMFSRHLTGPGRRFQLEGLAMLFLHEVIASYCGDALSASEEEALPEWEHAVFDAVSARIRTNPGEALVTALLASEMGVSENRLNSIFRIKTGKSCAEVVRAARMELAKKLLEEGDLALKQVAVEVGFNHVSNFSRAYRRWFGENPGRAQRR